MKAVPTILTCVVILGACAGGIYLLDKYKAVQVATNPAVAPRVVSSQVVHESNKRIDVTTHGTVAPRTEISVVAQVSGSVTSISDSLENGGFFAAQAVLVQLDDRDYRHEVTRVEAVVAQASLRVTLEEAEALVAAREWEEVGKGVASPLTLRVPQVQEAKAALAAAKASLATANLALERTTIRAPFAGRVRAKSVDVGQFVATGTRLARIYAVDFAEVRLPLHDSKLRYLDLPLTSGGVRSNGEGVAVTLRARFAQRIQEWTGTIVRTEGEVDPKSRMIHAIARVADPYSRDGDAGRPPLSVGMFVEAVIHGKTFENVIEIPRDAVRDGNEVLVIDENNKMFRRKIQPLHRGERSVVVEKGLEEGERICLSAIGVFVKGMKVELAEEQPREPSGDARGESNPKRGASK
jgi:RND family efflux transporter MFP subunit